MKFKNVICLMLIISVLLCGCSSVPATSNNVETSYTQNKYTYAEGWENYTVLIYDTSDASEFSDTIKIEYSLADKESYKNITPKAKENVVFKSKEVSLTYDSQTFYPFNYYPIYKYYGDDGCSYKIDPWGKVVGYSSKVSHTDTEIEKKISEKTALEKAKDFIKDFIDISEYSAEISKAKYGDGYTISFTKYVGDIESTDYLTLDMKGNGEIDSFFGHTLGQVPTTADVSNIDIPAVKSALVKRMEELCVEEIEECDYYNIAEPYVRLTVLKDGKLGLIAEVDVEFNTLSGEYILCNGFLAKVVVEIK